MQIFISINPHKFYELADVVNVFMRHVLSYIYGSILVGGDISPFILLTTGYWEGPHALIPPSSLVRQNDSYSSLNPPHTSGIEFGGQL